MANDRTFRRVNECAGANGRANGHDPASLERGGLAASDDASGIPVANVTAFPATASLQQQVGTDREACAEVAPPPPNGAASAGARCGNSAGDVNDEGEEELPEGKYPLPDNPAEFVEEIHRKIDLIEVWHSLLRCEDEKVKQRAIEKLTGMLYEDGALAGDDPQQFIFDLPRPKRD